MTVGARGRAGPALAMVLVALACGHRGSPRPPVYPAPPAIPELQVAQRGTQAILRFPAPVRTAEVGGETVEVREVEVLVYAERYAALTHELLATALERERDLLLQQAAQAAAAAERATARRVSEADGPAPTDVSVPETGEPAPETGEAAEEEAPEGTTRPRGPSPEEELLRRVPPAELEAWRRAGVPPDALLHAARELAQVVTALWDRLGLPRTFIDRDNPPALPDPGEVVTAADPLLHGVRYEREIDGARFLERAAVAYRISVRELEQYQVGELLQVAHAVGIPSPGPLRTRYFFAVRSRSARGQPGDPGRIRCVAPEAVPLPPGAAIANLTDSGVELSWSPPRADLWGRLLDPATVRYNVYRGSADGVLGAEPINGEPIADVTHTDSGMEWGRTYTYEIRSVRLPAPPDPAARAGSRPSRSSRRETETLRRESAGARLDAVDVVDRFPPPLPSRLRATRAGTQVTLQWDPSTARDLRGYRVYRHSAPAPTPPATPPRAPGPRAGDREQTPEPVVVETPDATTGPADVDPQAANPLVEAGWRLLTPEPVTVARYVDPEVDPETAYAYAVEALDRSGNVSPPSVVELPAEADP